MSDHLSIPQAVKPTRRIKFFTVDPAQFMALFTKGLEVRERFRLVKGVPRDAQLIAVSYEPIRHVIILVVQSSKYQPVPIDEVPPHEYIEIAIGKDPPHEN